jgi:predicted PurR-regulated permease PerM
MERVRPISGQTTIIILIAAAVVLYLIRPVVLPFVLAGAIAYVADPAVQWLAARTGWRRWLAALAVFVVVVGLLAGLGRVTLPTLAHELLAVATHLQAILQKAIGAVIGGGSVDLLGRPVTAQGMATDAVDQLRGWLDRNGRVFAFAAIGPAVLFGTFLFLVLLFYFLADGPRIGRGLVWLVPPERRPFIERTWSRVDPVLKRYFVGVAAIVFYTSAAAYVGLALFLNLPGALLLALITGVLELVPMIGPAASAVLAGLVAVQTATGIGAIIGYAIYATLLRLSIDQLIGPLVLGRATYLHPVLVMFCYLGGGYLFGAVGLVLAVPVALTTRIVLQELYDGPDDSGKAGATGDHRPTGAPRKPEQAPTSEDTPLMSLRAAAGATRKRNR